MLCSKCNCKIFKYFDDDFCICTSCGTLAEKPVVTISEPVDEVIVMASKKCKTPGCTKFDVVKGYCTTHARENGFGDALKIRNAGGSLKDPDAISKLPSPAIIAKTAIFQTESVGGAATKVAVSSAVIDVMAAIDDAWADKRSQFLSSLTGFDARIKLKSALQLLTMIEEMPVSLGI